MSAFLAGYVIGSLLTAAAALFLWARALRTPRRDDDDPPLGI